MAISYYNSLDVYGDVNTVDTIKGSSKLARVNDLTDGSLTVKNTEKVNSIEIKFKTNSDIIQANSTLIIPTYTALTLSSAYQNIGDTTMYGSAIYTASSGSLDGKDFRIELSSTYSSGVIGPSAFYDFTVHGGGNMQLIKSLTVTNGDKLETYTCYVGLNSSDNKTLMAVATKTITSFSASANSFGGYNINLSTTKEAWNQYVCSLYMIKA